MVARAAAVSGAVVNPAYLLLLLLGLGLAGLGLAWRSDAQSRFHSVHWVPSVAGGAILIADGIWLILR
jgi:hypothetical protein